jgi:general secretion pathway protein B
MSFILDALRKSEHERQRQAGPGLAEVAVAAPKTRTNVWATAAVALLVVNLAVVGVLLMRKADDVSPTPAAASGPSSSVATAAATSESVEPRPDANSIAPPRPVTRQSSEPPPMLRPAEPDPAAPASRNPLEEEVSGYPPEFDPRTMSDSAATPVGPPAVTRLPAGGDRVVYETLPEADPIGPRGYPEPAAAPAGLPTADEMSAGGGVPELRLELHVYSNRPTERFAFINSRKYREGDTLQEGPRVEEITPDGVVLDLRGRRFLLPRE